MEQRGTAGGLGGEGRAAKEDAPGGAAGSRTGQEEKERTRLPEVEGAARREGGAPSGDNHLYRAFFRDETDGVLFATAAGEAILDANGEACRILGRSREELLVEGGAAIFDSSDSRLGAAREEQRRTGKFRGRLRVLQRLPGGDEAPLDAAVTIVGYEDRERGEGRLVIVVRDVAGCRLGRRGEEFRGKQEWFHSLARYTSDIVVVLGADESFRYVSPSTERVLGYRPEDLAEAVMLDVIHPDDFERIIETFAGVWDTPGVSPPIMFRARHEDGSWLYVELSPNNLLDDEEVRGVVILGRDVTERVRSEEETRRRNEELERRVSNRMWQLTALIEELRESERTLRERKEHLRKLNEATFEGIVIHEKGRILESNETFAEMFGYKPEEVVGMHALDFVAPESRDLVIPKIRTWSEEPYEAVGTKKDGTRIVIETRRKPWIYRGRRVRLSAVRDVTELKEKEKELRESEERLRTTFEQAAVGIAHVDLDGRWLWVNPKLCETIGHSRGELLTKTFQEVTHPEDLDADLEQIRRLLGSEIDGYSMDKRYVKRDGSHVWIKLRVSLVRDAADEPSYFISVVEDIDERKRAELALHSLTPREKEVLMLLGEGRTNPDIAERLVISASTAKFHVKNIIEKLGVADRKQAAERASELSFPPDR